LCFAEIVRTPHRVTRGLLPLILLARPTPAGERVWVWLRPGLDLTDVETKTDKLAVACFASEVRVVRASERFAALVRIDVARRDPLKRLVASPLPAQLPDPDDPAAPARPSGGWSGLDLKDIPAEIPEQRGTRR
jgi:hypothetical protein